MKLSMVLVALVTLAANFAAAPKAHAKEATQQAQGIFHYDADGQLLAPVKADSESADSDSFYSPFPYATSCSCNLTDSCSVSCNWNQTADCSPYNYNGAFYCSCSCY